MSDRSGMHQASLAPGLYGATLLEYASSVVWHCLAETSKAFS